MRSWPVLLLAVCAGGAEPTLEQRQLAFATRDAAGFERLGPPGPRDWRSAHPERTQSFDR
jgi:hypothetical protein